MAKHQIGKLNLIELTLLFNTSLPVINLNAMHVIVFLIFYEYVFLLKYF